VISFIVPAHNEEALLGRTLAALHASTRPLAEPYEIVVADDASIDATAVVARGHGARVVGIDRRQISAARNAGARAATGDLYCFVDADTVVTGKVLRAALRALRGGAVGGGCAVRFDGQLPRYAVVMERVLPPICHAIGLATGCFIYCTRAAYNRAGGFDETLYAAEEVAFSKRLKRLGRFVILRESVTTSGRKVRAHSARELFTVLARLALGGPQSFRRREGLELWYGPRAAVQ
jgi:glycosyltransferase involved in cell wall biosynthesis